jgi:hypothetical protein
LIVTDRPGATETPPPVGTSAIEAVRTASSAEEVIDIGL